MRFLPIVERELRVASRRKGTYRLRSLLALAVVALWFLLLQTSRNTGARIGPVLFIAIGVLALGYGLLSGVFLTSVCLSEEKREGTLGLLFLTELKGYDVVLGKLMATSLHAIYGLLAMLPVLSLPLLMGGVTAGEFWRVTLVLVSTLFWSLSLGMLISAFTNETRQAMAATLLLIIFLAGLLPLLWWLLHWLTGGPGWALLLWLSPGYLYSRALSTYYRYQPNVHEFWLSLLTVGVIGLGSLLLASLHLPRAWGAKSEHSETQTRANWRRFGTPHLRRLNRLRLEWNPFFWLTSRDRHSRLLAWWILIPLFLIWLGFVPGCFSSRGGTLQLCFSVVMFLGFGLHLVIKVLIAVEASHRFSEDRQSGAMELLLVTPLPPEVILKGQRRALWEVFRGPILLVLVVNAVLFWIIVGSNHLGMHNRDQLVFAEMYIGGAVLLLMDFKALSLVGMKLALEKKKHHYAIGHTLLRILVPPWLGILLFVFIGSSGRGINSGTIFFMVSVWFILCIFLSFSLASHSAIELQNRFRRMCSEPRSSNAPAPSWAYQRRNGRSPQPQNLCQPR